LSRDDGVVGDVLCLTLSQIEFKAAPPTSGTFSMRALPFALLDRSNVFLLMVPDSITLLKMPTSLPAAPGGAISRSKSNALSVSSRRGEKANGQKKIHWREFFLNQWTSLSPVCSLLKRTVNFAKGVFNTTLC
jgi:hypothetical protein